MSFDWITPEISSFLWSGFKLTIWITAITSIVSLIIGIIVGTMKMTQHPILKLIANIHIEIHRNVPVLVLIIFWAFALPNIFPLELRQRLFFDNKWINQFGELAGLPIPYYTLAAGIAITLNASAYLAELFRAGVGTIQQEHIDAARTLGATKWNQLWHIIIPQGIRAAFPAISTRLIHIMKNTALAAFVSTPEFFHTIQTSITRSYRALELLTFASIVYLLLSLSYAFLLSRIEKRLNQITLSPSY